MSVPGDDAVDVMLELPAVVIVTLLIMIRTAATSVEW